MEEEKKKTTFLFVFLTYLPVFLLKFRSGELVGCGIKFRIQRVPTQHTFDGPRYPKNKKYLKKWNDDASNEYPLDILLMDPATPKTRNTKKYHVFLGIYCFWGSGVHQKYVKWVLVGCGI